MNAEQARAVAAEYRAGANDRFFARCIENIEQAARAGHECCRLDVSRIYLVEAQRLLAPLGYTVCLVDDGDYGKEVRVSWKSAEGCDDA